MHESPSYLLEKLCQWSTGIIAGRHRRCWASSQCTRACRGSNDATVVQGIPTTRAGSLVTSDTMILRDPLYSGNAIEERASTVLRIAPTLFRFGSFEIFNQSDLKTGNQRLTPLPQRMHGTVGNSCTPCARTTGNDTPVTTKTPAGCSTSCHSEHSSLQAGAEPERVMA